VFIAVCFFSNISLKQHFAHDRQYSLMRHLKEFGSWSTVHTECLALGLNRQNYWLF